MCLRCFFLLTLPEANFRYTKDFRLRRQHQQQHHPLNQQQHQQPKQQQNQQPKQQPKQLHNQQQHQQQNQQPNQQPKHGNMQILSRRETPYVIKLVGKNENQ